MSLTCKVPLKGVNLEVFRKFGLERNGLYTFTYGSLIHQRVQDTVILQQIIVVLY